MSVVKINSLRPSGEHGDKPTPYLEMSMGLHGVELRICDGQDDIDGACSVLVEVSPHVLSAHLSALDIHTHQEQRVYDEFQLMHRKTCQECKKL